MVAYLGLYNITSVFFNRTGLQNEFPPSLRLTNSADAFKRNLKTNFVSPCISITVDAGVFCDSLFLETSLFYPSLKQPLFYCTLLLRCEALCSFLSVRGSI